MKKRILAMLLTVVMAASVVACGNTKQSEESKQSESSSDTVESTGTVESTSTEPEEVHPVKISLFPLNGNLTSGLVGGWLGNYLLEKGIILEIWPYSKEKFNAMLTSGDFPDVVYIPSNADLAVLAESELFLDLNEYMDQMPHVAENEKIQTACDYVMERKSNGVLNAIPLRVGAAAPALDTERHAVKLNWQVYEQIGAPEIDSWDGLIEVLKLMQEVYPESAVGEKTYGIRLFPNDGSYFYSIYNWFQVTGHTVDELANFIECDMWNESFDYILADDSNYKAGLAFFNKMYKAGLLDPESMNKDRATQQASVTNGGSLAGWAGAPGWEQYGYYPVYFDGVKTARDMEGYPFGTGGYIGVSAESENIEAALKFVDMLANPDELLTLAYGPEGELWELDDTDKVVVTQKGIDFWVNGVVPQIGNEDFAVFNTQWLLNQGEMTSYGDIWAVPSSLQVQEISASQNELKATWQKTTGYDTYLEWIGDSYKDTYFYKNATSFVESMSDDQKLVRSAAKDILVQASWKMVYAETEDEFETIWDEAVAKCEEAGIKAIYDWRVDQLTKGIATRDSIMNK